MPAAFAQPEHAPPSPDHDLYTNYISFAMGVLGLAAHSINHKYLLYRVMSCIDMEFTSIFRSTTSQTAYFWTPFYSFLKNMCVSRYFYGCQKIINMKNNMNYSFWHYFNIIMKKIGLFFIFTIFFLFL